MKNSMQELKICRVFSFFAKQVWNQDFITDEPRPRSRDWRDIAQNKDLEKVQEMMRVHMKDQEH